MSQLIRRLLPVALLLTGCAAPQTPGPRATPPGVLPIFEATGVSSTEDLMKIKARPDLEIRPTNQSVTPAVVTEGEVGPFVVGDNIRPSFSGSADGAEGWHVDNILLVEVVDPAGNSLDNFVIGFVTGQVFKGAELLENVGDWSPKFAPRSPDLSLRLPHGKPIKLKVTALDNGNGGSVSALYLVLEKSTAPTHELRDSFWEAR